MAVWPTWAGGCIVSSHNQELGRRGEDVAAEWYSSQGYRLLDRNWRCAEGEIDLIAARGDTVAFVEVKTRSSSRFGTGAEAVTVRKQRTIRTVARRWLADHDRWIGHLRFDVVSVTADGDLNVLEDCF